MNYIVFDMEWNQPYPGERLLYKNNACLNNEIIQIGAVKLDESCEITDTFSMNIKPSVIKKLNHNVKKLTGIDESLLNDAENIKAVAEKFRRWCGEDFVFITWGYDDMGVLGGNLKYFSLDTSWLPECYNLQMIFCSQTDNENRQYSLSYAAEYFKIETDKPLHNALTDAYYTALVCGKLDMKKGISTYHAMIFKDKSIPEHMKNIIYKRNHPSADGYDAIIEKCGINSPACYQCGKKTDIVKQSKNGSFNYLMISKCEHHGEFANVFKINKTGEKTYNATEQCFAINKYNREYFLDKAKKMELSDKKRKRSGNKKSYSKSKQKAQSSGNEKAPARITHILRSE